MSITVDVDGLLQAARLMDNDDEVMLRDRVALLQTVKDLKTEIGYFSENDLGNLRERVRLLQKIKDLQGEIGHFFRGRAQGSTMLQISLKLLGHGQQQHAWSDMCLGLAQ